MPRTNPGRDLTRERSVAARVAYERDLREWSLETMAKSLTEAGCPIPASAIYKIEKGDPPRSITLTEFLTFAAVFGVTPEELLEPVEVAQNRNLQALLSEVEKGKLALRREAESLVELEERVRDELRALGNPSLLDDWLPAARIVDTKTGQQLTVELKRETS